MTATRKPRSPMIDDSVNDDLNETEQRKTSIPKAETPIDVRVIQTYKAGLTDESQQTRTTETNHQTENQDRYGDYDLPFRPYIPQGGRTIKENTLAAFFNALAEATENNEAENFMIMITRLADMPSEIFARPQVMYPANFPPMQCNAGALPTFINEIQKLNGRSGGRFEIRACLLNGEVIEDALLTNFVIPDPVQPLNIDHGNGTSANSEMIAAVERMSNENRMFMERMLTTLKPEPSEMDTLARQVMIAKLTEATAPKENPTESMMMQLVMMPQIMETFANKMSDAMSGGKAEPDKPTWLRLLESPAGEAISEKAGTIIENFSQLAVMAATAKAQEAGTMSRPIDYQPAQAVQPIEQNPAPPSINTDTNGDSDPMTELIEDLIDEVENGEPFTDDNEFLRELRELYPMEASFIKMLCNDQTFDELFKQLATKAPQLFEPFVDPATQQANERGQHAVMRLREFYYYLRGEKDPLTVSTTVAEPPQKSAAKVSPETDKPS